MMMGELPGEIFQAEVPLRLFSAIIADDVTPLGLIRVVTFVLLFAVGDEFGVVGVGDDVALAVDTTAAPIVTIHALATRSRHRTRCSLRLRTTAKSASTRYSCRFAALSVSLLH